jgi:hypothetical protein
MSFTRKSQQNLNKNVFIFTTFFLHFQGYTLTSPLIRPHPAPSPVPTHHQIHTVIHLMHRQVPASYRTSTAAVSMVVNISVRQVQMLAYRNSHDRKADRANENQKISKR